MSRDQQLWRDRPTPGTPPISFVEGLADVRRRIDQLVELLGDINRRVRELEQEREARR